MQCQLNATDKGFTGQFTVGDSTNYEVMVKAESNSFFKETEPQRITIQKVISESIAAEDETPLKDRQLFPWLTIVTLVAGTILLTAAVFTFFAKKRKENILFFKYKKYQGCKISGKKN
jgi:Ca-activated chloride channel homolog